MANRINRSLASWAITPEEKLQADIAELTGKAASDLALRLPRTAWGRRGALGSES